MKENNLLLFSPLCSLYHVIAEFCSAIFSQSLACPRDNCHASPWIRRGLHIGDAQVFLLQCLTPELSEHLFSGAVVPELMSSAGQPLEVSSHIYSYKELRKKEKPVQTVPCYPQSIHRFNRFVRAP